ncbi:hypothetical protein N7456_001180 [Penicillium angulare]|uniref:Uncharacterized protein n=1 Tax=Penicillium angulare TaxID=116970 RepID=A0A9W9GDL0_9EURO|nr:hypothetical protein N7456_001180 [Penicillium angulare]
MGDAVIPGAISTADPRGTKSCRRTLNRKHLNLSSTPRRTIPVLHTGHPRPPEIRYVAAPVPTSYHTPVFPSPAPGSLEAPIFEGNDATEFLRWYERMMDMNGRRDEVEWCHFLPSYCEISDWLEGLVSYKDRKYTVNALNKLVKGKDKRITGEQYRDYIFRFKTVSAEVIKRKAASDLECCRLFTIGLPDKIRRKVSENLIFEEPNDAKFDDDIEGIEELGPVKIADLSKLLKNALREVVRKETKDAQDKSTLAMEKSIGMVH